MERIDLGCQVCLTSCSRVVHLKNHMNSTYHRQKMADVFHKETFKRSGFFPQIIMINPQARREIKQPIVGLSLMTLCFSQDTETYFYLCHVCEEKRPAHRIASHLSSIDHFRNYFSYANPNVLSFSWIPSMDKNVILTPEVQREIRARGPGKLQVLDLPENLLEVLEPGTYSEVMRTLSENDKLLKLLEAVKPERTMIQTYQRDSNRKHPLLGMQHLVECICVGTTEKRYYLCMLCHLTLATHMVIKHVLSFDHIHCYFREWHPSTLLSKGSYRKYDHHFGSTMLDLAKQAEDTDLQSTVNTDMKQVSLEPAKFTSVNFASYAEALKKLESIRKENKDGSLITVVKPGNRLQPRTSSAVPAVPVVPAGPTTAAAASAAAARGTPVAPVKPTTPAAPATSVSPADPAGPAASAVSSAPAGPAAAPAASAAAARGTPVAPVKPTTPAVPATAVSPADPAAPAASSAPAGPAAAPAASAAAARGTLVAPVKPTTPAVPATAVSPAVPAGPAAAPAGSAAAARGTLVAPVKPTTPAVPATAVSPADPAGPAGSAVSSAPAGPAAAPAASAAAARGTPVAPVKPTATAVSLADPADPAAPAASSAPAGPAAAPAASAAAARGTLVAPVKPTTPAVPATAVSPAVPAGPAAAPAGSAAAARGTLVAPVKPTTPAVPATAVSPADPAGPAGSAVSSAPAGPAAAPAASAAAARGTPVAPVKPTATAVSLADPADPAAPAASSAPAGPAAAPAASAAAARGTLVAPVKPTTPAVPATAVSPAVPAGPAAAPAGSAAAARGTLVAPVKPTTPAVPATAVSPAVPAGPAGSAVSSAPAGPAAAPAASAAAAARGTPVAPVKPTATAVSPAAPAVSSAPAGPTAAPAAPVASTAEAAREMPVAPAGQADPAGPAVPAGAGALSYKLHCQNCSMGFEGTHEYFNHLSDWRHKQMLKTHFGGCDDYKTGGNPSLDLYKYHQERLKQNQPLIGLSLVVTCISSQVKEDPIYVCFACEDCFPKYLFRQHFDSMKHLINTLLHQNPWRLPFAWDKCLNVKVLRSMAWEEEKERGPKQMLLKVLDIPSWTFKELHGLTYTNVMARVQQYHTILRRDVPPSERHSKLQQEERFPLLGANFVVMFNMCSKRKPTYMGFLCFLCKRRLRGDECHAHVFSREHVANFLRFFHRASTDSSTSVETLLDLAIQATWFNLITDVQMITLNKPIWEPCPYKKATKILEYAMKKDGNTRLRPPIVYKNKLVPRETLKEDKDHVRDNSENNRRTLEGCEKTTSQNSDGDQTALEKISVGVGVDVSSAHCVESGENTERGDKKETPTPSDKESKRGEVISKTSSEEIQNAGRETCKAIKEEKIEEPTSRKPMDGSDGTEVGKQTSGSITLKRKISHEDTCPAENVKQEMDRKRQRLTSKEDAPCNEPQNVSEPVVVTASSNVKQQPGHQLWEYIRRQSRDPVIGLDALLECSCGERDPVYLCECCSLKIPERCIISHVTRVYHQNMYLAAVDLDDETFNNISKQDFKSAIQTVKALQNQQDSGHELPSTSAPPRIQPKDTPVTLHPQHGVCSVMDDHKVVAMEIDSDPEDFKAQPSSVTTAVPVTAETTSDTTRVPRESNKDVSMSRIKASESADNVNTSMTVCRSSKNKVEIISNTNVGPLKTATTSKHVGTSQTAAASDSTVTSTSMTATSKFMAKTSSSTPDTTKSTAPCPRHTAATSICTAAASKFTATSSPSSTTISSTTTKSATMSKTLENRPGAAAKVPTSLYKTATTPKSESTVVREAPCRTVSKIENASKTSKNASKTVVTSQTMGTPVATAKMSNTEASVKTAHGKNSVSSSSDVAPNAAKSNALAPRLTARSENKNPHAEPSHTSVTSNTKPSESFPRIGLNQLIAVMCNGRQQVYCQLCSVRLKLSNHTSDYNHVSKYLKVQYPGWIAKSHGQFLEKANQLAEVEKDIRSQAVQRLEVGLDEYKKLSKLPQNEAIERLKEKLIQGHSSCQQQLSSPSGQQQVPSSSPWEISSPDDGMCMQQNEGLSTDKQSQQENRHELQTHLVQISEIESTSEKREPCALGQSGKAQSMKSPEPDTDDLILDQPHSHSILNENEPITNPSTEDTGIAVDKPQGHDVRPLATDSADRSAQTPDACQETLEKRQQQQSRDPRLWSGRWKVLEGSQKTSLVKSLNPDPPSSVAAVTTELQNHPKPIQKSTERVSEHSQELQMIVIGESIEGSSNLFKHFLMVKGYDPETVIGLGSVWECQGIFLSPFYLCESCAETLSISNICPHMVSKKHQLNYLRRLNPQFLSFMECDLPEAHKEKILNGVAERVAQQERYNENDAQVIMLRQELYERARKAPFSEALIIVQRIKKAKQLSVPWQTVCTPEQMDQQPVAQQSPEESPTMETQPEPPPETDQRSGMCIQQNEGLSTDNQSQQENRHELQTHLVQISDQQPVAQQSPEESPTMETQPEPPPETDQRSGMCIQQNEGLSTDNQSQQENRHELQTHLVQISEIESTSEKRETPAVGQSDGAQSMKSPEPPADNLISDQPHSLNKNEPANPAKINVNPSTEDTRIAGARQETETPHLEEMVGNVDEVKQRRVLSPPHVTSVSSKADSVVSPILGAGKCPQDQPEPRVPVLPHQRPMSLEAQQAEVHSEFPSCLVISPQTSQTLSETPGDKCPPARKRKADECFETPIRSCTSNPQLEDPSPAKRTCRVLQPVSQPSLESATESTSVNLAATSTLTSVEDTSVIDMIKFAELMALVRQTKSEVYVSPRTLAPDNGDTNTSVSGVERVWDPNPVKTTVVQKTRWDLKWELVKVTNKPPPSNKSEEMFSTAAPVVSGHENQLVTPNASSVFSASSSSLGGSSSTRSNLLFEATEATAFSTMLPSASTVDPSDPQQQRSDSAQSISGNQSNPVPNHCTATSHNLGQTPQVPDHTDTDNTGVPQLPINTIVTVRSYPPKQQLVGDYNRQDSADVNRGDQVTHSLSTVSSGDAPGGDGQYSQMACVTTGQSGYMSFEAVGSYPTLNNPPAHTWSSYQYEGQTTRGLYPTQIYPQQEASRFSLQSFGQRVAAPQAPEWAGLGMQQRGVLFQEQYFAWPSAPLTAGVGTVVNNEAAWVPFMIPPNSSQMMDMNQYRTSMIAPTLNSNDVVTQNISPQVQLHPAGIYYLPAANTETTPPPSVNPFFASGARFLP